MKNVINYYYNMSPTNIHQKDRNFTFSFEDENYYFVMYNRNIDEIKALYELNIQMLNNNLLVHEIISNKDRYIITLMDNIPYVLLKVYVNVNKKSILRDVIEINNSTLMIKHDPLLDRSNWTKMWSDKVDYFEYQINQFGKKYPILSSSLSYFTGLAENAISYIKNTQLEVNINNSLVVCNRRITSNDTYFDTYNPLNYILDNRVRDLSEYIKAAFFSRKNIWIEITEYFKYNNFTLYEYRLLFGRLLYPSFYFDIFEDVINENIIEKEIVKILEKMDEYEDFLLDVFYSINSIIKIPEIDWLSNKKT
jgi:spore coat protein YutH